MLQQDAVREHGAGDGLHILKTRVRPAGAQAAGLGGGGERERGARAGAETHTGARGGFAGMRGVDEAGDVVGHRLGQMDAPREREQPRELVARDDGGDHRLDSDLAVQHDALEHLGRVAADINLEQEAVELRLGQRVGALEVNGVLRGEHEERVGQRVRLAPGGHAALLHGLEQRRLRFGRGAVNFVGEEDVGENRAALENEDAFAVHLLQHGVAGDVAGQ